MRNSVLTILVLGLLLTLIVAPFSALALLMTVLFVSAFGWMFWTIARTFIFGTPREER